MRLCVYLSVYIYLCLCMCILIDVCVYICSFYVCKYLCACVPAAVGQLEIQFTRLTSMVYLSAQIALHSAPQVCLIFVILLKYLLRVASTFLKYLTLTQS